tara:strand:+ start:9990 stop:10934 length:945 start_codon:yes stop_codon:yes gene_type:complete
MGIKLLNKLLEEKYSKSTKTRKHLSYFKGKKIAIDISIYLYNFKRSSDNWPRELYRMCIILRHYKIDALFVYDGETRDEKKKTIEIRQQKKEDVWQEIVKLEEDLKEIEDEEKRRILENKIKLMKRGIKGVTRDDLILSKQLLKYCGMNYIESEREADDVCAALCKKNIVYGVMSNDTDMFAFGCGRILKNLNLTTHHVEFYNLDDVLVKLRMGYEDFKSLCILSGTDYNFTDRNIFYFYYRYGRYLTSRDNIDFVGWLMKNRNINSIVYNELMKVRDLYDVNKTRPLSKMKFIRIKNKKMDVEMVNRMLFGDE